MSIPHRYHLPWTARNHPNGWIEPTTRCQLHCPSCYRDCTAATDPLAHRPLAELKEEVRTLTKMRNLQTITIGGGEPLLYPELDDLVRFIAGLDLRPMIVTNGILLDEARLSTLETAGASRIVIHVARYQGRGKTEAEVNSVRDTYCRMFRRHRVTLGFSLSLSQNNIADLDVLTSFFKANADVVRLILLTILRQRDAPGDGGGLDGSAVFDKVRQVYGLEYCAYVGRSGSDGNSWIFAANVFAGRRKLGSVDGAVAEWIQCNHLRDHGRYLFVGDTLPKTRSLLLFALRNRSLLRILLRRMLTPWASLHVQTVLVNNTPHRLQSGWDVCDPCADAILYEGRLVPSCLLDRVKVGENMIVGPLSAPDDSRTRG